MTWQELQNESTEDLVDYIKSGAADPAYKELADAAFIAFTFRFRKDLVDKCVVMLRKWDRSEDDAIELANRVFARFYKYPKYDAEKCRSGKTDQCVRKYLYGFANKEIIDFLNPEIPLYDGTEQIVTSLIDPGKDYEPEKLKVLQEYEAKLDVIFAKLTPKHKTIFLTYHQYEISGHNLPGHLLKSLRDSLGLSQISIRVYKKEAKELVQKELANGK